ncbi:COL6A [Acanthosepion pharaonis]|uniref:COL6A n=1 Tax=Acanthosepion pharaonis TaxID=158019 RepID=A0A812C2Y3_ACAPH|nr:COL6A [Sepia pharaonis]
MRTQMFTQQNGDRPSVANIAILLTDGVSNVNAFDTIPEAEKVRADNIHIYGIGIGLADTKELSQIASLPISENMFVVKTFDELSVLKEKVFEQFCPGGFEQTSRAIVTRPPITVAPTARGGCANAESDIIFILDSSTSVSAPNFKKMLDFIVDFVSAADIDSGSVRIGAVLYSTDVEIQFHLNKYSTKQEVIDAVREIPYVYGSTNTYGGLNVMRTQMFTQQNGDRPSVANIAILLTDGVSNVNAFDTIPEAEKVRADNIHIYGIGIGLADTKELSQIASLPISENMFVVKTFDELSVLKEKVFEQFCPGGFEQTSRAIVTRPPITVAPTARDSGNVRIGAVLYSTDVEIQFHLNEHSTKQEVIDAVREIPYVYGSTNTYGGLNVMRTQMFTQQNGDRPSVANIAILLTDGVSNVNAFDTIPEAEKVRADNIHIYGIGIGLADTKELSQIASPPISENMFVVKTFDELSVLKEKVFEQFCPGRYEHV